MKYSGRKPFNMVRYSKMQMALTHLMVKYPKMKKEMNHVDRKEMCCIE